MKQKHIWKNIFWLLAALLIATLLFLLQYFIDNKYNAPALIVQEGMVTLPPDVLGRPVFLSSGWELYPDQLLTSKVANPQDPPPLSTWIGQLQSFSSLHADGSPYGTATYRLQLKADQPMQLVLLLQEVHSACAVYVNGELVASAGSVSPYAPLVKDLLAAVPVQGQTELVIQTANYTHYYSGINYPPALGTPDAINQLVFFRTLFYGFLCFSTLAFSLFSAAVWLGIRKRHPDQILMWFGLMTLSFSLRICYPLVRTAGLPLVRPLYAVEDAAFFFGIWCAFQIVLDFSGLKSSKPGRILLQTGLHALLVGILFPLFVLPLLPAFVPVYGQLVYWYKLLTALLLVGLTFYGAMQGAPYNGWLLTGVSIYSMGLFAHALFLGRFEPAYTGWPDEYGGFALVACFAVVTVLKSFALVDENIRLRDHLQREVDEKTRTLHAVLEDRRQFFAGAAHDLKAPMTSLQLFAQAVERREIGLDPETQGNIQMILRKSNEMRERLELIQDFAVQDARPSERVPLDCRGLVEKFYHDNLPDLEVTGVSCHLKLPFSSCVILGDEARLLQMLQNLVYNALSFTPMDGTISISLEKDTKFVTLRISDTGCGIAPDVLPRIFDRFFTTRAEEGGTGMGLYLVHTIAQEHGGKVQAASREGEGTTFTVVLPRWLE